MVDNYFWLREKSNPEVIKYLEQENAYTAGVANGLKPFEDALYNEMLSHVKQTDLDVPVRRGDYYYSRKPRKANNTRSGAAKKAAWREKKKYCSI